ncbi:MAG: S8 family peptidase, partial [Lachnospiraceae bacterium]|nr:S8 family peptidase [Lachnospiraceae bacterium]
NITSLAYFAIPKCYALVDTAALEETGILTMQNFPTLPLKGDGVLMGFIDTGVDYMNPIFQDENGMTRILRIWDQTVRDGTPPEKLLYGSEYTAEDINQALRSDTPYEIVPSRDTDGHGTFLTGVAAGSPDIPNAFVGAAPGADIAIVKLKQAKQYLRDFYFIKEGVPAYQENDIMAGISYLHNLAYSLSKPLVICLGLGTNSGGHGGFAPLAALLHYVGIRRMRAITVATGNEANARHHYLGNFQSRQDYEEVEISVGENVGGFIAELWSNSPEVVSVAVQSPTGELLPLVLARQGERKEFKFLLEGTIVSVDYSLTEYSRSIELAFIRFIAPAKGIWKIRVYSGNYLAGRFHIWLPNSEFLQGEVFFLRSNPETTITGPSSAVTPMSVGGFNAKDNSIYLDSGRGFNIFNQVKPDFLAPAVEVFGPNLNSGYTTMTGTSVAAAIAAGAAAQMMEWGVVRGNDVAMNTNEIKNYFLLGADRDPGTTYPNQEEGYGRLNIYKAFTNMRSTK